MAICYNIAVSKEILILHSQKRDTAERPGFNDELIRALGELELPTPAGLLHQFGVPIEKEWEA